MLPSIYSDGMVLQRNQPILFLGKATPQKTVKILFANQQRIVKTDDRGCWEIQFPPLKAGGPYELKVQGQKEQVIVRDILIGDVWLCSGQSNMQWVVNNVINAKNEIKRANYPQIRTLNIPRRIELTPKDTITATWTACSPETVGNFSGVAYFFAQKVYEETNVPIGIINASWGGTIVETWTSLEAAGRLSPNCLKKYVKEGKLLSPNNYFGTQNKDIVTRNNYPSLVYNAMIHPLLSFNLAGVIWYQGENNVGEAESYKKWLTCMIGDWRRRWNHDFPFYIVQLPNYDPINKEPLWAEFRWAQCEVLSVPNTYIIVTSDLGEPHDIHPRNKQEVGRRIALQALHHSYNRVDIVGDSPSYEKMEVKNDSVVIFFKNIGSGLEVRSRYDCLQGFAIAGRNNKFYWAKGRIDGNKVILWHPKVPSPIVVRYNWENNPDGNLYSKEGLPVCLFHTGK